jgi:N-acetylglucosamine-6-phosphate deacetylase
MAEKIVMTNSGEATAAIFGAFDMNVRMIERAFDVRISNRNKETDDGDAILITGEAKNADKAIMISDSLMCKGFETGTKFLFGGHEIEIYPDGSAHLVKEKNLAGSTMKMNEGLRNLVERALVPFDKAVNACTINPARLLGMDDTIGKIETGYDADLAILNDDYSLAEVYCKGKAQF